MLAPSPPPRIMMIFASRPMRFVLCPMADGSAKKQGIISQHRSMRRTTPMHKTQTDGSLELVARQDPDLDASLFEIGNRFGHAILQFVFDGRRTEEQQIPLDFVRNALDLALPIVDRGESVPIALDPRVVFILRHDAVGKRE